jgi:bacterioferritin
MCGQPPGRARTRLVPLTHRLADAPVVVNAFHSRVKLLRASAQQPEVPQSIASRFWQKSVVFCFDYPPFSVKRSPLYNTEIIMKGDDRVIEYLNEALKNELTAVNQYFLHYRLLMHWGVKKLGKFEYGESIDEMKHADRLADRILFLDGLPNFQLLGRLKIGESVEEILKADLALELEAIPLLKEAIAHCESVRDYISRDLLADILDNEEEHVDTLERQFDMIVRMGLENYIQLQSEPAESGES